MDWKIGDDCFVMLDGAAHARVTKIGKRWLTATTDDGKAHDFDLSKPGLPFRGPAWGYTPQLWTPEQVRVSTSRRDAYKAALALEDFVQRCQDVGLLDEVTAKVAD